MVCHKRPRLPRQVAINTGGESKTRRTPKGKRILQNSMWISWGSRTWVIEARGGRWSENWSSRRSWTERALDLKEGRWMQKPAKPIVYLGTSVPSYFLFCPADVTNSSPVLQSWVLSKWWVSDFLPPKAPIFLDSSFQQGPELNDFYFFTLPTLM